jgi:hypothetical protein
MMIFSLEMKLVKTFLGLAAALFALMVTASAFAGVSGGWYYTVESPYGGTPLVVGPYDSQATCRDWLGSALFMHPSACHTDPNPYNCRIIGVGYEGKGQASNDCTYVGDGWGFFWYPPTGGGKIVEQKTLAKCQAKYQEYQSGRFGSGAMSPQCVHIGNQRSAQEGKRKSHRR